jgi:hypothetical protein
MKNNQTKFAAATLAFSLGCGGDAGPDSPQLTTYIHDPYVIAQLDELARCPTGSNTQAEFVVFNASLHRMKTSTEEVENIPQGFSIIGLYVPEHMHAVPESGVYGLLLDYTADLQRAMSTPSDSILTDLSPEDQQALIESCNISSATGTTRIKMGPLGNTLLKKSDAYCNPPYLGGDFCWNEDEVYYFLDHDPWRGPMETYDRF